MADYDIGAAFAEIEDELISSMVRNLKRHKAEEITEGMEWAQWQALQLQALEDYKRKAAEKFGSKFSSINDRIEESIVTSYTDAQTSQEREILRRIQDNIPESVTAVNGTGSVTGEFFRTNDRKLDALVKATTGDMQRAETAVLRMTDDKYRRIIFNAQVYANTGAGTYEKAVDMATKDFLSAGINCIEYKNGRRVNIRSYAEMAIRTANKRAYLQGEGEMRKKWGIHTVIMNKRTNPCPKCAPFVGKVIVDDVWSGGTAEEAEKSGYLLMSDCIKQGLYHPNCQDSHTTYFGDILDEEDEEYDETQEEQSTVQEELAEPIPPDEQTFTPEEQALNEQLYTAEQRQNYCERQVQRFERMSKYSLDEDNQRIYRARKSEWKEKVAKSKDTIEEIKRKIVLDEEKQVPIKPKNTVKKPSVVSTMIGQENISDIIQKFNFGSDNSGENEEKTVANSSESGNKTYTNVKNEYEENATPGIGAVTYDEGYDHELHKEEISFADWLHNYYGGDIRILNEVNENKVPTPDYLWNNKLWDLKSTQTEKAANSAIRKGLKQIEKNPGGIILNYGNLDISIEKLQEVIDKRMQWYQGKSVDIMIVNKGEVIKILRYNNA